MKRITYAWTLNENKSLTNNNYNEELDTEIFTDNDYTFDEFLRDIHNIDFEKIDNTYYIIENGERTGEAFLIYKEEIIYEEETERAKLEDMLENLFNLEGKSMTLGELQQELQKNEFGYETEKENLKEILKDKYQQTDPFDKLNNQDRAGIKITIKTEIENGEDEVIEATQIKITKINSIIN